MAPENSTFGASVRRVVYHINMFYPAIGQKE